MKTRVERRLRRRAVKLNCRRWDRMHRSIKALAKLQAEAVTSTPPLFIPTADLRFLQMRPRTGEVSRYLVQWEDGGKRRALGWVAQVEGELPKQKWQATYYAGGANNVFLSSHPTRKEAAEQIRDWVIKFGGRAGAAKFS